MGLYGGRAYYVIPEEGLRNNLLLHSGPIFSSINNFHEKHVVVVPKRNWSSVDLNVILEYLKTHGLSVHLHLDKNEKVESVLERRWNFLHFEEDDVVKRSGLKCLTHLGLNYCKPTLHLLFNVYLPMLRHLNLLGTALDKSDLRSLDLACNGPEKKLPNLSSLCLSLTNHMGTNALTRSLFSIPFLTLDNYYMQYNPICYPDIDKCLRTTFPNLTRLGIHHKLESPDIRLGFLSLNETYHVESLTLFNCLLQHVSVPCLMNLSKL